MWQKEHECPCNVSDNWHEVSSVRRHLFLRILEYNWGLIGPGSWEKVAWSIYDDRYYRAVVSMIEQEDMHISGALSEEAFSEIRSATQLPWEEEQIDAVDGEAWQIKHFEHGRIIKTSGAARYFYGCPTLTRIISQLPDWTEHTWVCPLADRRIENIDCLENCDVVDGIIIESSMPLEFKTKPEWRKICKECPYHAQ